MSYSNQFIDINHGAGGKIAHRLIRQIFADAFDNPYLAQEDDGAVLPPLPEGSIPVMSTDAHIVHPLRFSGGNIGTLALCGTLNDLAMMAARPLYLTCSFILEEGLPIDVLQEIVQSMAQTAREADVMIVAGDTKVVEKGHGDGIFISTAGLGIASLRHRVSGANAQIGDKVLISGTMGDHAMAILQAREQFSFAGDIASDCANLSPLVQKLCATLPSGSLKTLRDPTRGGVCATLNEISAQSQVGIRLDESALPVQPKVAALCEFLGLEPINLANEGKMLVIVAPEYADEALTILRADPLGQQAAIIGEIVEDEKHRVTLTTALGASRIVAYLAGESLPRIC